MAREVDSGAAVEVRMDSRLVIEQMAGRWKIKHPDMKPLALAASRARPAEVTWTWVPREQNKAADALVNMALDGDPVSRHAL
jgi:ribonuclease HI